MSRVIKESFYEISAKFEEEFENAEVAAKQIGLVKLLN
mgnify:CR=1 FL=1